MKRLLPILALLAALPAGCGDAGAVSADLPMSQDAVAPAADRAAPCAADPDCPTGQSCSGAAGVCVATLSSTQVFSVAVDPVAGQGLPGDQFPFLALAPFGTLDLALPSPVRLTGRVVQALPGGSWSGMDGKAPDAAEGTVAVAGTLVAVAEGRIPGTQFRSEAAVSAGDGDAGAPTYALDLLPGLAYRATFVPGKGPFEGLPPHVFDLSANADAVQDVVLPPQDAYVSLQGVVRAGGAPGGPVRGAWVSCQVGGDRVGTTGATDGEGLFQITLPPGTGTVTVTVAPGRDGTPIPTRRFTWDAGLEALQQDYAAAGQFLALDVGPVPAVRSVSVQVLGGDAFDTPVPLARLVAAGTAGQGESTVSASTGSDGVATMDLLEGRYVLAVLPPAGSPWAATETTLDLLKETSKAFLVRLPERPVVQGTVVRPSDGRPVAGAAVAFLTDRATSDLANGAVLGSGREATFEAVTDALGRFSLALDPGQYAATVTPPAASGLPRVAWPTLDVTGALSLELPVPEGALVRGTVRAGADGRLLEGATVRLYFPVSGAAADRTWSLGDTSFAEALQTVAVARTGADGSWDAVVPLREADRPPDGQNGGIPGDGDEMADFGTPEAKFF